MPKNSWRELSNPKTISPDNSAYYFEFPLDNGSVAHLVVAYLNQGKWRLKPFIAEKTAPCSKLAKEQGASAAINGGYFNLSDGTSASYIHLDGKLAASPQDNKALIENPKLKAHLSAIFNRSEIRVLEPEGLRQEEAGKLKIQIARHNDALPDGYKLIDSLQAGPQLLPKLNEEEEAFMRKQADGSFADSISCKRPAARSAFGLSADGYALILAVSGKGQDPESSGINLQELSKLMRRLGCREAINLDGGSSTSLFVKIKKEADEGKSVCAKDPETLVKSILLLMPQ